VTDQLYETYSHADYNITVEGVAASTYLVNLAPRLIHGWVVDCEQQPDVQASRLAKKKKKTENLILMELTGGVLTRLRFLTAARASVSACVSSSA
jgi:hypothetical protein